MALAFAGALAILVGASWYFHRMVAAESPGSAPLEESAGAGAMFSRKCAGCHGANGGGGLGPSLAGVEAKGDAEIRARIRDGSPTKGMPAFGTTIAPAELDALVEYVKGL